MPCGWSCDKERKPYDPKRDMRYRRTMRRRMRHAVHKKDKVVLSEEGECRSESMGKGDAEVTKE